MRRHECFFGVQPKFALVEMHLKATKPVTLRDSRKRPKKKQISEFRDNDTCTRIEKNFGPQITFVFMTGQNYMNKIVM